MSEPTTAEVLIGPFVSDEGPAVIPMDRLIALRDYVTALQSRCEELEQHARGWETWQADGQAAMDAARVIETENEELQARVEELETRWQELEHPFDKSEFDLMAARVESLERERDHWKAEASGLASEQAHAERTEAEVQRLREALKEIRMYAKQPTPSGFLAAEVADAALSEEPRQ